MRTKPSMMFAASHVVMLCSIATRASVMAIQVTQQNRLAPEYGVSDHMHAPGQTVSQMQARSSTSELCNP